MVVLSVVPVRRSMRQPTSAGVTSWLAVLPNRLPDLDVQTAWLELPCDELLEWFEDGLVDSLGEFLCLGNGLNGG